MRSALSLLLMLCGPAPARAADPLELPAILQTLEQSPWNARMHAVHMLEPHGRAGLPGLRRAAQDADWQVRLTAVHFLGRLGRPAMDDLADVLHAEPCRHVRISAIHWLGAIGTDALPILEEAMTDDSPGLRAADRYWRGKIKPGEPAAEEGEVASELRSLKNEDTKLCLSSYQPSLARWRRAQQRRAAARPAPRPNGEPSLADAAQTLPLQEPEPEAPLAEPQTAAPLPPAKKPKKSLPINEDRYRELDALLASTDAEKPLGPPETLPPGDAGLSRQPAQITGAPSLLAVENRKNPKPNDLAALPGAPQTMPQAPAGQGRPAELVTADPALMNDAGTPKTAYDALPELILALSGSDARSRARAADEVGRLGPGGKPAVGALIKALKDKHRQVRASAALALGNVSAGDEAVPGLVAALKDPNEDVQSSAALALGRLHTPAARKAFRKHLRQQARDTVSGR